MKPMLLSEETLMRAWAFYISFPQVAYNCLRPPRDRMV